tara:strand:+ start:18774 stop:19595 length:822 start_codon:yes stop_codon:yes gene_type:complete
VRPGKDLINIGWFSSGRGEGSRGLLSFIQARIDDGLLDANIQFVFSNRIKGEFEGSDEFLDLTNRLGIPLFALSSDIYRQNYKGGRNSRRDDYDKEVLQLLSGQMPDICVLAGYMLILSEGMCTKFPFINLHPALPEGPIGTWQQVIWDLIDKGSEKTGAMTHLATPQVDRGPVLSYCTNSIIGSPFDQAWAEISGRDVDCIRNDPGENLLLFQLIRQSGYAQEPYLIYETLNAISDGRINLNDGSMSENYSNCLPLCLDKEIALSMSKDGLI